MDTRSFLARLKSRKLLVQVASWLLGAVLVRYGADHPNLQPLIGWALGALGLSGGAYHIATAVEDQAAIKAAPPSPAVTVTTADTVTRVGPPAQPSGN